MLTNLKQRKDEYRYDSGTDGKIVRVEVTYEKHDRLSLRGVWVRVSPIEIQQRDGYTSETHELFGGMKSVQAMQLARSTPRVLVAIAEKIDPIAPELAVLFAAQGKDTCRERIKAALGLAVQNG